MGNKPKRPRIPKTEITTPAVSQNVEEFKHNTSNSSDNAKLIHRYRDLEIEIWIDKHYENRVNFGDENGQRVGIEQEKVLQLIIDSVKYVFYFYLVNKVLAFINMPSNKNPVRNSRIVIKDFRGEEEIPLNIAIEIHFLTFGKYEITIKTAMKTNDYKLSDSQYVISLFDGGVNLNKFENKALRTIEKLKL